MPIYNDIKIGMVLKSVIFSFEKKIEKILCTDAKIVVEAKTESEENFPVINDLIPFIKAPLCMKTARNSN